MILVSWGTLRCPGILSGLAIHTETKPFLIKINLQINKTMIKMNKQRYFDVSFRYSRESWGVLGVLGCPGVIRPTRVHPVNGNGFFMLSISGY